MDAAAPLGDSVRAPERHNCYECLPMDAAAPLGDSVRAPERQNCYECLPVDAAAPLGDSVRAAKRQNCYESVALDATVPLENSVRAAKRHNCYESVVVDAAAPLGDSVRALKWQKLTPQLTGTEKIAGCGNCGCTPWWTGLALKLGSTEKNSETMDCGRPFGFQKQTRKRAVQRRILEWRIVVILFGYRRALRYGEEF